MSIKLISSRENPLYKELKLLASSSQARKKTGRTLLDGVHLCDAYLHHVGMPLFCVASETAQSIAEVAVILASCEAGRVQCVVLPDTLYAALSQVEHGVELLFVIDVPRLERVETLGQSAVLLDSLQDPGNLGSILRSAAAAGIEHVYCSPGTALAWSPKVLRSGMGAHFLLKIFEGADLAALIENSKVPVVATSSHARQQLYELDLKGPVAWLFGHEGQGVSMDLLERATHQAAIPHLGAIESLNVAASAAICFFEQVRQKSLN
ncbi:MAG: RNA methyltransferase [Burkholderiales bacterium RIFCSPLOWO2_02_FULL_57_36]|nr:MAG: RNA methyltransferase [Burkholderiales bacterium RIFCSPLOWO2_02_FULL_57_36]